MSRFHRYFKKCEEFALCAEVSDGNVVEVEDKSERYTLYQIVVKVLVEWEKFLIMII